MSIKSGLGKTKQKGAAERVVIEEVEGMMGSCGVMVPAPASSETVPLHSLCGNGPSASEVPSVEGRRKRERGAECVTFTR